MWVRSEPPVRTLPLASYSSSVPASFVVSGSQPGVAAKAVPANPTRLPPAMARAAAPTIADLSRTFICEFPFGFMFLDACRRRLAVLGFVARAPGRATNPFDRISGRSRARGQDLVPGRVDTRR